MNNKPIDIIFDEVPEKVECLIEVIRLLDKHGFDVLIGVKLDYFDPRLEIFAFKIKKYSRAADYYFIQPPDLEEPPYQPIKDRVEI
jgi:hypothetical protein